MSRPAHSTLAASLRKPPLLDRTKRVSDQIYDWLREAILTLDQPPGTPISEVDLSAFASVSRTPVREALKRLEQERLVITYPNLGSFVSKISMRQIEESIIMRILLEGEAAAQAAAKDGPANAAALREIVARQRGAAARNDVAAIYQADEDFHRTLFAGIGYDLMWASVRLARTGMQRLRGLTILDPGNRSVALTHHDTIVRAIHDGDAEAARSLMADHVRSNWQFLSRIGDERSAFIDYDSDHGRAPVPESVRARGARDRVEKVGAAWIKQ